MIIEKIEAVNFRNHCDSVLALSSGTNVLVGMNAQGKTNLLEAVYLTCVGRGWRTIKDKEMINFESDTARVKTFVRRKFGQVAVDICLSRTAKKTIKINGIPVQRMGELMGHVNCVFFSPDELRLVKDAPADRRKFLDIDISQIDKTYFYALLRYNKILLQRNALLKAKSEDIQSGLNIWDVQLAKAGAFIIWKRIRFAGKLRDGVVNVHNFLTNGKEKIDVSYEGITSVMQESDDAVSRMETADDAALSGSKERELGLKKIEEILLWQIQAVREKDLRLRTTTVGPHRDDLRITVDGKDVRLFASQGQQRTVALSLKLAELEIFREATGEMPVLLLDDVFSELDAERQARLVRALAKCQSIITAVEFPHPAAKQMKIFKVASGTIV